MQKIAFTLVLLVGLVGSSLAGTEIRLDLSKQRAYLVKDGKVVNSSPIASGRSNHPTPSGTFRVVQKDPDHRSTMYGKVVNAKGKVIVSDADSDTPVPKGGKFVQAPMKNFLRFTGPIGMHAGHLPGYAASHGCVRLPAGKAATFYRAASIGTPVKVYGRAPYRRSSKS